MQSRVVAKPELGQEFGPPEMIFEPGLAAGAAFAVGLGLGVNARNLSLQANEARFDAEFHDKGAAARANATGANVAYGLAATTLVGAIVAAVVEGRAAGAP